MRIPEADDYCAYCWFEGSYSKTICFDSQHWCSWHQGYVPALSKTRPADRIPPGAQDFKRLKETFK